jgi:alkanesulfonate monooxygenase SsuD/methylene tetrahydromethanopterin reductase-like flavin-dependent oxidoreductase (luciferase family)
VRYGLTLPVGGACSDPEFLVDLAELAEAVGWDGVFLEDYVVFQGDPAAPTCDPWVALAAIAVRTKRIVLGTKVTPLSRRRPWNVARQATTIDHLSEGRMVLGVGLGDVGDHVVRDASFTSFGEETNSARRAEMLDESLEIISGLWTAEPFEYTGRHYSIGRVTFLPLPKQRPRIPIWVGGGYPNRGPTERAARWDGSILYRADGGDLQPEDVSAIRRAAGDKPYDISISLGHDGNPEAERDRLTRLADAGATWATVYIPASDADTMRRAVERLPLSIP